MNKKIILFFAICSSILAVSIVAANVQATNTNTNTNTPWDPSCIISAVQARDGSVANAATKYYNALMTTGLTRNTDIKAAYNISDQKTRKTAIKAAWKKFTDTRKALQKTWKNERDSAWKTYKTDRATCKNYDDPYTSSNNDSF